MNHRNPILRPPQQSKVPAFSTNRHQPQFQPPADTTGAGENRLQTSTFFTKIGDSQIIYTADRMWCKVTLTLMTAGPVAVGQYAQLAPVTSGRGQNLQPGVPTVFNVAKANTLYVASTAINAISILIEPYPWLETITGIVTSMLSGAGGAAAAAVTAAVGAVKSKI